MIRGNVIYADCECVPADKNRFGCFDTEFVISEVKVNANYNFWADWALTVGELCAANFRTTERLSTTKSYAVKFDAKNKN